MRRFHLIVVAAALFIAGFVYEPDLGRLQTPFSHYGTDAVGVGVLVHVFGGRSTGR